jgi:hypothetical protein
MKPLPLHRILACWWRLLRRPKDADLGDRIKTTRLELRLEAIRFGECETHKLPRGMCDSC